MLKKTLISLANRIYCINVVIEDLRRHFPQINLLSMGRRNSETLWQVLNVVNITVHMKNLVQI